MAHSVAHPSGSAFLDALEQELQAHPVHTNPFFRAFQRGVTEAQLRRFVRQWYRFGIQFRKILIGLLYNLSDQDETIGLELARVLFSEYGNRVPEDVHAAQMLRLADRLGIDRQVLARERLCPEAQIYLDDIGEVFLHGDMPSALGASFGIETTAGLTYRYLYSGLLTFPAALAAGHRVFRSPSFRGTAARRLASRRPGRVRGAGGAPRNDSRGRVDGDGEMAWSLARHASFGARRRFHDQVIGLTSLAVSAVR